MKFIIYISWVIIIDLAQCQRTSDKMYDSINGASCFKRLNATHETGCTSSFSGSVGVLHLINTIEDFKFILNNPPSPPYAPVVFPYLFTRENILPLKNTTFISALVLINNTTKMTQFSQELRCPNPYGGLLKDQTCDAGKPETAWNPFGTGLLHETFPFPIYYIHDLSEIAKVTNCIEKFNNHDLEHQSDRSLCSIEIKSHMNAAVNSVVCTRRNDNINEVRYCDPLQGKNVFATLFPRKIVDPNERKVEETEKFILVSTRFDTTSMFDGIGQGAMESLVPISVVIATSHLLSRILPQKLENVDRNILFMFFNGESYDYIGSQRFVYDAKLGNFPPKSTSTNPINITNIELMIDIATLDDLNTLKIYTPDQSDMLNNVVSRLNYYNQQFGFNTTTSSVTSLNLPPSSAQTILRDDIKFPGLILTSKPSNRYYHSLYDDYENILYKYQNTTLDFTEPEDLSDDNNLFKTDSIQIQIRNVSSILAFTLYELLTNKTYNQNKIASSILIDEFMYCFLQSSKCPLFNAASAPDSPSISNLPMHRYISVQPSINIPSSETVKILAYLIGQKQNGYVKENCTGLPLYWFGGINGTGECHLTTQNFSQALSPAFLIDNYNWTSGKYSTWTESAWHGLSATIFLRPSKMHEVLTLSIGIVVMIISFVIVFLINSRSDVLFGSNNSAIDVTVPPPAQC